MALVQAHAWGAVPSRGGVWFGSIESVTCMLHGRCTPGPSDGQHVGASEL